MSGPVLTRIRDGQREKRCVHCHKFLPATRAHFNPHPEGALGLHNECKVCRSLARRSENEGSSRYWRLRRAGLCDWCRQPSGEKSRCDECRQKTRAN